MCSRQPRMSVTSRLRWYLPEEKPATFPAGQFNNIWAVWMSHKTHVKDTSLSWGMKVPGKVGHCVHLSQGTGWIICANQSRKITYNARKHSKLITSTETKTSQLILYTVHMGSITRPDSICLPDQTFRRLTKLRTSIQRANLGHIWLELWFPYLSSLLGDCNSEDPYKTTVFSAKRCDFPPKV